MPGLAQRFQDDSSSDGSTSDTSFDLGPPAPLIQQNCDIFDSSDDSSYSDDSATMPHPFLRQHLNDPSVQVNLMII